MSEPDQAAAPGSVRLAVVLVHGLWHGSWAWQEVLTALDAAGVRAVAVDLPMTDLAADVAEVRRVLDRVGQPVVLVGHSYGGAVITEAGAHDCVRQLVYLAGFPLSDGESVGRTLPDLEIPGTRLGEAMRFSDDGARVHLDPLVAAEIFYDDAPAAVAQACVARLRPVGAAVFSGVPTAFAWRWLPTTYVVSADDRVVHPDLQRAMAARVSRRLEWPGGHSQAATHPQAVADLVASLAG